MEQTFTVGCCAKKRIGYTMVQDLGSTNLGRKSPVWARFGKYRYKKSTRRSGSGTKKEGTAFDRSPSEIG